VRREGGTWQGSGPVELVDKKAVAAGKLLGASANGVGEVDRLLVDEEFFEREGRLRVRRQRRE
jgi:hypothetical protein